MQSASHNLEIEVKFFLPQAQRIHRRLSNLGAIGQPEHFETNLRFDHPSETLKRSHQLLRLRMDNACRLTFKRRPLKPDTECKTYQEFEVTVSDCNTMNAILNALGFKVVQRYEKRRQIYTWRKVELCIDTMPFGTFLEIEGSKEHIKATAAILELPWQERILLNYLAIFEFLRRRESLPFTNVTFDNFQALDIDMVPYLPHLWAKTGTH